jgi:hypothetical protein
LHSMQSLTFTSIYVYCPYCIHGWLTCQPPKA